MMKQKLFFLTFLISTSALAQQFVPTGVDCKVEFNLGTYKENIFGSLKRKTNGKFNSNRRVDSFGSDISVNKDGSAFFTSSSYIENNTHRLSTLYRSQLDSQDNVLMSMSFNSQGEPILPDVNFILGPHSQEFYRYQKSETIELPEPVLWKEEGRSKLMIESVFYSCKLIQELKIEK